MWKACGLVSYTNYLSPHWKYFSWCKGILSSHCDIILHKDSSFWEEHTVHANFKQSHARLRNRVNYLKRVCDLLKNNDYHVGVRNSSLSNFIKTAWSISIQILRWEKTLNSKGVTVFHTRQHLTSLYSQALLPMRCCPNQSFMDIVNSHRATFFC